MTVDLQGHRELVRRIDALPPKIQRRVLRTALRATMTKIARPLRAGTPRGLGTGRKAVKVTAKVSGMGAYGKVSYKGRPAAYLGMRERGTRRQPARPFFVHATAGWRETVISDLSEAMRRSLEKSGG